MYKPTPMPPSSSSANSIGSEVKKRTSTAPKPQIAQPRRIAAPKDTTIQIVYSDGACKGNGRPGSVAGIGVWWAPNDPRNLSERCPGAQTNNRAELVAIARILETVPQSSDTLIIRTDSLYSQQSLTSWSFKWRKNGWKKANGDPVLNKDLMDYILTLLKTRHRSGQPVRLEYVKAHSGDVGNDGADALAVAGCSLPEIPEQDWAGLKETHILEQDMMADLMDGINPDDFLLNDEDLMRELEEDYRVT